MFNEMSHPLLIVFSTLFVLIFIFIILIVYFFQKSKMMKSFEELSLKTLSQSQDVLLSRFSQIKNEENIQFQQNSHQQKNHLEALVNPMKQSLKNYEGLVRDIELRREGAYKELRVQVEQLGKTHSRLSQETSSLRESLSHPKSRGYWGQVQLRRCVELAGMMPHVDFEEEAQAQGSLKRPDMVVRLPSKRSVIIDAKTPALGFEEEESHKVSAQSTAQRLRAHMKSLAQKNYPSLFQGSAPFVLMFLASESLLYRAFEEDPSLLEDGIKKGVHIVSPTSLISFLKSVELAWREKAVHENAQQILKEAQVLFERVQSFENHFGKVESHLIKAQESWTQAKGSYQRRLIPQVQKMKDLGSLTADSDPLSGGRKKLATKVDVEPLVASSIKTNIKPPTA